MNPESGMPFTEVSAWELIAHLLEEGYPIQEMVLDSPAGTKGLVLHLDFLGAARTLYIKLHPGGRGLFCRSFHYSERTDRHGPPWRGRTENPDE